MDASTSLDTWLQLFGRLHPLTVHFPIALLLVGAAIELLRPKPERPSSAGYACLVIGALAAVVAALFGWLYAEHDPPGRSVERTLFQHRWIGVGTAAFALFTVFAGWRLRVNPSGGLAMLYRASALLCAGLVGFGAHLGGTLVYGEGFLTEVLDRALSPEPPATAAAAPGPSAADSDPAEPDPAEPDSADLGAASPEPTGLELYTDHVQPILAARCYECHGSKKRPKGDLRLDDLALVFDRPEDAIIVPGDPKASLVYQRIVLPPDHEDVMPAKGEVLSDEEIGWVRDWIEQGAPWEEGESVGSTGASGAVEAASIPATSTAAPENGPESRPGSTETAAREAESPLELSGAERTARDRALDAIGARGAYAGLVAQDTDAVEVNLGILAEDATDADLELLAGLEPCLVSLDLSRTSVTDAGVQRLDGFPRLRRLRLDNTGVGDAAMPTVAGLERLELLNLVGTEVSDDGIAQLEESSRLERLYVWGSAVSAEGAEALAAKRPGLEIERGADLERFLEALDEMEPVALRAACCDAASAEGRTCDHPCCVEAAERGEVCPECGVAVETEDAAGEGESGE